MRKRYGQKVAEHVATRILLYLAKKGVGKLAKAPLKRFLRHEIRKAIGEAVAGEQAEALENIVIFLTREYVYEKLGHNRVGHHTLMAKDHGREFLYKPMKDCARLLHWHIVTLMTQRSVVESPMTEYVDWLVLLVCHPRHPAATPPAAQSVPSTIPTGYTARHKSGRLAGVARQELRAYGAGNSFKLHVGGDRRRELRYSGPQGRGARIDSPAGTWLRRDHWLCVAAWTDAALTGLSRWPWARRWQRLEPQMCRGLSRSFRKVGPHLHRGENLETGQSVEPRTLEPPPLMTEQQLRQRIAAATKLRRKREQDYTPPSAAATTAAAP